MTCRCSDDDRALCAGGGVTPPGELCRCPHCHNGSVLDDLRIQVARAVRAHRRAVDVFVTRDLDTTQVDVAVDGRVGFWARSKTAQDAAQLVSFAAFRALDFGSRVKGRGGGAPVVEALPHPVLAGLGLDAMDVRPHAAGIAEYAEAAREDGRMRGLPAGEMGRAYRMEIEIGDDLTGEDAP